ncbi:hypothetical protein BU25DRAFT_471396 [Macroventuria anomochaeta]|uniref:Uncharacterized protein n=1 Tax=Macroventuria anomochaeta TaxID=301207 RepID=A0ACB6RWU1_9PLEO|nr:uncharacterized protein BU25DRAFT_471396 [Macroventuria anomochaeta]KAF2626511.1 hypothetical protein BU25DRAFT_471396 [Macroventuria anomochaeta]
MYGPYDHSSYHEAHRPLDMADLRQMSYDDLRALFRLLSGLVSGADSTPHTRAIFETMNHIWEITQGTRLGPEYGEFDLYGGHHFQGTSSATIENVQLISRDQSSAGTPPPPHRSRHRQSPGPTRRDASWVAQGGLPDTHRLNARTRPHSWPSSFVRVWSTAELRGVLTELGYGVRDVNLHGTRRNIEDELEMRDRDPAREARVVTEFVHAAPVLLPQQQDVHVYPPTRREIHVHPSQPQRVDVYEPRRQVDIHHHQLLPRIVHHHYPSPSAQTYIQRAGAPQAYERPAPQAEDVEFRARRRTQGKNERKKGNRGDSSDEDY